MSYCRWSCLDYQSDIYCYESQQGFEIHVASRRRKRAPRSTSPYDVCTIREVSPEEYVKIYRQYHDEMDKIPFIDLDFPHAGESFCLSTPGECADKLKELRGLGFKVPEYAIDNLEREEQFEGDEDAQ